MRIVGKSSHLRAQDPEKDASRNAGFPRLSVVCIRRVADGTVPDIPVPL